MIEREPVVAPETPLEETIIYELHARGYTIDPSSGVRHPGTFAGLAEKIGWLYAHNGLDARARDVLMGLIPKQYGGDA